MALLPFLAGAVLATTIVKMRNKNRSNNSSQSSYYYVDNRNNEIARLDRFLRIYSNFNNEVKYDLGTNGNGLIDLARLLEAYDYRVGFGSDRNALMTLANYLRDLVYFRKNEIGFQNNGNSAIPTIETINFLENVYSHYRQYKYNYLNLRKSLNY